MIQKSIERLAILCQSIPPLLIEIDDLIFSNKLNA
jgi:hypothetical protein